MYIFNICIYTQTQTHKHTNTQTYKQAYEHAEAANDEADRDTPPYRT